jgi:hypothetical protein
VQPDALSLDTVSPDTISDEELAELALAADPEIEADPDAVSVWEITGFADRHWLPSWYMPSPVGGARLLQGWRRHIVLLVIASFLVIDAYGLCNTYGWVKFG